MSASAMTTAVARQTAVRTVRVAIVGAGAAGLQASKLLCEAGEDNVLILEARNRIGGRIHTTNCQVPSSRSTTKSSTKISRSSSSSQDDSTPSGEKQQVTTIRHDEGAAWVHGLGYDWPTTAATNDEAQPPKLSSINPMLPLLLQEGTSSNLFRQKELLNPLFPRGNPWMRPQHCLVEPHQLAVYVNGHVLQQTNHDNNDSDILQQSLDRHWDIMAQVDEIGQTLKRSGKDTVTLHQSLHETLEGVLLLEQQPPTSNNKNNKTMESLRQFYVHLIEIWYAGSSEDLQLREFMDTSTSNDNDHDDDDGPEQESGVAPTAGGGDVEYSPEGDFYGPHCTVKSGMSSLLKPLTNHGEEIMLEQEVVKIRHHGDGNDGNGGVVVLETQSGLVVHADACIVAIPLACLQAGNIFEPKLSVAKQESIGTLRVGHYKKVFLTFDRIFWPADPAFVGFIRPASMSSSSSSSSSSPLGKHLLADNLWARDGLACLEVILVADAVAWANGRPTEEIRDAVLDFLAAAVDGDDDDVRELCIDCKVTRWEEDPYSRGAYSTFGTGCEERHAVALRDPEWGGRLVFAGEHTISEFEGSVHAALFSGYDSSKTVLEFLKKNRTMVEDA